MHPYFHGTIEHFSLCAATVNCLTAVVTTIIVKWLADTMQRSSYNCHKDVSDIPRLNSCCQRPSHREQIEEHDRWNHYWRPDKLPDHAECLHQSLMWNVWKHHGIAES